MGEVLFTAEAGDEVGAVVADGQLGDEDDHFLSVLKDLFAEDEHIRELFACRVGGLFQRLGTAVKIRFQ